MPTRALLVDPTHHAAEIARFWTHVVKGPTSSHCWVWTGAIADDGYGRFWLTRDGSARVVRPHRYALALAHGLDLADVEVSEHLVCDVPICVHVQGRHNDHVWASTQAANLATMGRRARGGGARTGAGRIGGDRASLAARSRALRAAVRDGWDQRAVDAALYAHDPTQLLIDLD